VVESMRSHAPEPSQPPPPTYSGPEDKDMFA